MGGQLIESPFFDARRFLGVAAADIFPTQARPRPGQSGAHWRIDRLREGPELFLALAARLALVEWCNSRPEADGE